VLVFKEKSPVIVMLQLHWTWLLD